MRHLIDILGKQYTCIEKPAGCGGGGPWGEANHKDLTITVCQEQAPDQKRDTMIHEVIHAIEYALHLELEERQVHALAAGIFCVMRSNPHLVEYLMGKEAL